MAHFLKKTFKHSCRFSKYSRLRIAIKVFILNGPIQTSVLFLFRLFYMTQINVVVKSVDGVLGTRTREGADESTELWRQPIKINLPSTCGNRINAL